MARLKAEIALDNIPTHFGRVEGACTFTFEVLCPAAHDNTRRARPRLPWPTLII